MAAKNYVKRKPFYREIFCKGPAGTGSKSGDNYDSAKKIADGDLLELPAGLLVERVFVIVDVLMTGTTDIDVGDDDDPDGYVDGSLSVTVGTVGMYGWNAKVAGAYLRVQTAGATDAGDIYVVPNAKYYAAAGKTLKLDATGTNLTGAFRVIVEGQMLTA